MKNTFGNHISLTLFGESHGDCIGAVLDGLAPGVKINDDKIREMLSKRRPKGKIETPRVEVDEYKIVSGAYNGYTTGTPLTIIIPNENKKSSDYSELENKPRPSHADYTAEMKYHGYQDKRGGGHFSGRITAALVAAGAIIIPMLENKGIKIGTHITNLGSAFERGFENIDEDLAALEKRAFPTITEEAEERMLSLGEKIRSDGDSIGGALETAVTGIPAGVGEPWFDTVEGLISHAVFSIPAIKGIEFGAGFAFADMTGSEANDSFLVKDGKIYTKTNNNGGINGGITNGMPLIFRTAVKPTPSIFKEQKTVDLVSGEECLIKINGRHDSAIVTRIPYIIDAVTALVIADVLAERFGTDYFMS